MKPKIIQVRGVAELTKEDKIYRCQVIKKSQLLTIDMMAYFVQPHIIIRHKQ